MYGPRDKFAGSDDMKTLSNHHDDGHELQGPFLSDEGGRP